MKYHNKPEELEANDQWNERKEKKSNGEVCTF